MIAPSPAGTSVCPAVLSPQQSAVAVGSSAQLWKSPAVMAVARSSTCVGVGTSVCVREMGGMGVREEGMTWAVWGWAEPQLPPMQYVAGHV